MGISPVVITPTEPMSSPEANTITALMKSPARNLLIIIWSRYRGWLTRRFSVPYVRSLLMASKPMKMPIKGPISAMREL